jgi:hypothetical protein
MEKKHEIKKKRKDSFKAECGCTLKEKINLIFSLILACKGPPHWSRCILIWTSHLGRL